MNFKKEYDRHIPVNIKQALEICTFEADKIGMPIFLIGGAVRDIILNKDIFDTDITVQGDAIEFAKNLELNNKEKCFVKEIHDDFKTAKVVFKLDGEQVDLDIASTRKEIYKAPANLPTVEEIGCDIKEDIIRRDFTINSMALTLNAKTFCNLVDPLDGYNDLQNRLIRILHPISFIDDPTRIIRALKFRVRFDCKLEESTRKLQIEALQKESFVGMGTERIKLELMQAFNLNNSECLEIFIQEKMYLLLNKNIEPFISQIPDLMQIKSSIKIFMDKLNSDNIWLIYLGCLLVVLESDQLEETIAKLNLNGEQTTILLKSRELIGNIDVLKQANLNSEIYKCLKNKPLESLIILHACADKSCSKKIELYIKELSCIQISLNGQNLIEAGLKPGPKFSEILDSILCAKLNKEILTEDDETKLLSHLIKHL